MRILIIDDEDLFREDLATVLQEAGYECSTAATAEEGVEVATRQLPEVILCDIVMPGKSGIDILEELLSINPECAIIIMTAFGTLDTAIEAFRKGALDYLLKPLVIEDLLNKLKRIREHRQLRQEIQYLRRHVTEDAKSLSLVGKSRPMQEVLKLVKKVAPTQSTVLITGESGTGKEVVARAIHEFSEQRDRPFVAINCAGLQETLLESELFGHVKGAFTGAVRDKEGLFEVAGKGTVLLDEISEMPLALQSKLLRVLEQREFFRVGGTRPIPMQARIIAATNKDLKALVEAEAFREDLYFRIAVFEIPLPPLRERRSDIPLLVDYFVRKFNEEMKRQYRGASAEAIQAMMAYDWPGNIRELRNVVERAMILCNGEYITPEGLPQQITGLSPIASPAHNLKEAVHAFERTFIVQVLQSCGWNKEEAARRLQINPSTLYRKMAELRIEGPTSRKT